MNVHIGRIGVALAALAISGCATAPKGRAVAFTVQTKPAGALVETTQGFRCTTPCQVPLGSSGFVATVTLLGYKPVQVPVATGYDPGPVTIEMQPQDPGAGAPNPVTGKSPR